MSYREMAKTLIDTIPESKLYYVVAFLHGVSVPDETPNAETMEAMEEIDRMIATGTGQGFSGSTEDFFKMLSPFDREPVR